VSTLYRQIDYLKASRVREHFFHLSLTPNGDSAHYLPIWRVPWRRLLRYGSIGGIHSRIHCTLQSNFQEQYPTVQWHIQNFDEAACNAERDPGSMYGRYCLPPCLKGGEQSFNHPPCHGAHPSRDLQHSSTSSIALRSRCTSLQRSYQGAVFSASHTPCTSFMLLQLRYPELPALAVALRFEGRCRAPWTRCQQHPNLQLRHGTSPSSKGLQHFTTTSIRYLLQLESRTSYTSS